MPDALSDDHVAIIGIAGRFPGARDMHEFWQNLVDGVDSITVLTDEQLRANGVAEHLILDPDYVKTAPLVDDMAGFDATLFGYTPREAQIRDPQGRMFLEACHSALEDAGCDVARYEGVIGLYGGGAINNYGEQNVKANQAVFKAAGALSVDIANHPDYLTTETSYRLNLAGPSVNVQTACSTSLVAIHLACQALRSGDCTMALAGGVEVALPYATGHLWQEGGIFSKGGHVRSFDAGADGTVFGTGVGVVALKRLADARADGDHIYAVVRGSAVNNDGAARSGFTAPGVVGQTRLIRDALAAAQVDPGTISYVEAHGTGTLVGDPLEVRALSQAYRQAGAQGNQFCVIGSVKANLGHLGPAAGAAGLIKVCLAFQHGLLPPSVNFDQPNPAIDFEQSPFVVRTSAGPWTGQDGPRRAGVSSFGIGGTNAHLILEEPPPDTVVPAAPDAADEPDWRVLPVSARTASAADAAARRLAAHLRQHPELRLRDVAHTLQYGRAQRRHRRAVVAGDLAQAAIALDQVTGAPAPARQRGVVFLFPGQGSQHPGMGRDLYRRYPTYRRVVDECADLLRPIIRCDLRKLLMPHPDGTDQAAERLRQTRLTQPALFVVECALARLLASFGVEPDAMIGHSIGEYVAAHLAGVITLEDALTLVAARGELMDSMPAGAMLAVGMPEAQLRPLLYGDVEVAAVNSPTSTVVAGPEPAVAALEAMLTRQGVPATRLHTSHAFHSQLMEPMMGSFREWVADVPLAAPSRPFVSNVTGTWITDEQATDPEYWVTHLRRPVRFADGLATVAADDRVLVEVGPGRSLSDLARQCLGPDAVPIVAGMRHPAKAADDEQTLLAAVARLWTTGVAVDWSALGAVDPKAGPRKVSLPVYPYERQRFWVDADQRPGTAAAVDDPPDRLPLDAAIFAPSWSEAPIPATTGWPDGGPAWLVFSPGHGVIEALVDSLRAAGAPVVVAVPGDAYADSGRERVTIRPGERADYRDLLARFGATPPTRVVHGWTATGPAADPLDPDEVARTSTLGYLSLLYLAQELDRRPGDSTVDILAVSANLQDVAGGEPVEPAKALILGPTLLINRELVRMSCRSVDLALPSRQPDDRLVDHLRQELTASTMALAGRAEADAVQVAWRGSKRWTWSYQTAPAPDAPTALRPGGTYLLTGGLGGLGLTIARDLAETVQARLVLIGRSPFPDRSRWPDLLADESTGAALRSRLEAVRAIEAAGGQVMVAACDITDEAALRAVVTAAQERFGPIHGVFHAAGVAGGGMLTVRSREDSDRVLAPKVAGTLALCRVFAGRVDFISLFSSIAAVAGHYGMVDYCAANNFMDALARRLNAEGVPVHSIGWASWRSVGMVMATENAAPTLFRELEVGTRSVPVEHPLLERRIFDGSGDVVVATTLTPTSHWVVTDHRIGGVGVLPGTASLEIIHAALRLAEGGATNAVEISDVIFLGPIAVAEPRELRATLRPDADGYDVTIVTARTDGAVREWVEHVRARARAVPVRDAVTHDLDALRAGCDRLRYEPVRGGPDDGLVQFGEHWANSLVLHVGTGQELGRLELDERFQAECEQYTLHPALLDDAVSRAQYLPAVAERGDALLPFAYGRITVRAPLPPRFHTHVRHRDDGGGEIVSCDITLIGDDGRELVQIAGYALRRVNPTSIRSTVGQADGGATAPVSVPMTERTEAQDWGLEPDFAIAALYRILAARPGSGTGPHLLVSAVGLGRELQRAAGLTGDVLSQEIVDATLTGAATVPRSLDTPYVAPQSELERTLSSLWAQSLGVDEVGVEDDFFDLGGNSLVAVQLAARIRRQFDVELPLATLFEQSTVATLAAHVETALVALVPAAPAVPAAAV